MGLAVQPVGFLQQQTRIGTASGIWLDVIAADFFGQRISRHPAQLDDDFRASIRRELVRERGTRAAVAAAVKDLTGRGPVIFEPARTSDTGGYGGLHGGGGGLGYGVAGGWGSLCLPFQCFVTAYRPHGIGIATVAGWGSGAGGYARGAIEYASLSMVAGQVTDSDIFAAVAAVLPANTIAWTQIKLISQGRTMDRPLVYPGSIPLDKDLLSSNRNAMVALGYLAQAVLGTAPVVDGLVCIPTAPASMTVNVGPGSITQFGAIDPLAYGSLAANTTDPLVKMGINVTSAPFTLPAPSTSGSSINYLLQATLQESDANPLVLPGL